MFIVDLIFEIENCHEFCPYQTYNGYNITKWFAKNPGFDLKILSFSLISVLLHIQCKGISRIFGISLRYLYRSWLAYNIFFLLLCVSLCCCCCYWPSCITNSTKIYEQFTKMIFFCVCCKNCLNRYAYIFLLLCL